VKLFDGGGLFLLVTPSGGKLWRLKYRHKGKEKLLVFWNKEGEVKIPSMPNSGRLPIP
jgi:hypothetical protein